MPTIIQKILSIFGKFFKKIVPQVGVILAAAAVLQTNVNIRDARELNRPYVAMVERVGLLKTNGVEPYLTLKITLKNTGSLPAEYKATVYGWPCDVLDIRANTDYILPGQEVEAGFNLSFGTGCKNEVKNACDMLDDVRLKVEYRQPGQDKFKYFTSHKMVWLPATDKMLTRTNFSDYDVLGYDCGESEKGSGGSRWFVDEMR